MIRFVNSGTRCRPRDSNRTARKLTMRSLMLKVRENSLLEYRFHSSEVEHSPGKHKVVGSIPTGSKFFTLSTIIDFEISTLAYINLNVAKPHLRRRPEDVRVRIWEFAVIHWLSNVGGVDAMIRMINVMCVESTSDKVIRFVNSGTRCRPRESNLTARS